MSNESKRRIGQIMTSILTREDALVERVNQVLHPPQSLTDFKRASKNMQTQQAPIFRKACELAGVEPTRRQASKWNNSYGAAWKQRSKARRLLLDGLAENMETIAHVFRPELTS